jgi:hypothetical protein
MVTAVTDAAAASPATSLIHIGPCRRLTDRSNGDVTSWTIQTDIPDRPARSHHAVTRRQARAQPTAARRLLAMARAASPADRHSPDRQYPGSCQAQCPRQVQCLTRRNASAPVLASHDLGTAWLVRTRMRSSPLSPGSTWLAAASSARRSSSSRPSSGAVMPPARQPAVSSTLLLQHGFQRGHAARGMALHRTPADPHRRRYLSLRQVGVVA